MEKLTYTNIDKSMSKKIDDIFNNNKNFKSTENKKVVISNNFARGKLSYSLNKTEWNLFFYSAFKLNESKSNIVSFHISDFYNDADLSTKSHVYYDDTVKKLDNIEALTITTVNPKYEQYNKKSVLTEVDYDKGKVTIEFNQKLVEEFQNLLKDCTYQDMKTFISFDNKYSKRMYMYFRSFYRPDKTIFLKLMTIQELRDLLSLEEKQYTQIIGLKNRILIPLILEINENCKEFEILLNYEKKSGSRKIIGFWFSIRPKNLIKLNNQKESNKE